MALRARPTSFAVRKYSISLHRIMIGATPGARRTMFTTKVATFWGGSA